MRSATSVACAMRTINRHNAIACALARANAVTKRERYVYSMLRTPPFAQARSFSFVSCAWRTLRLLANAALTGGWNAWLQLTRFGPL